MEPEKICATCGGTIDVEVIRADTDEGSVCFVSFVVGTCRSCGRTFTEAELLAQPRVSSSERR